MTPEGPKVDYSLRPAKAAERQMLVEALARLDPLDPDERLDTSRYVGMGSIYFRDFQLVHRRLGIDDMISIENELAEERVRFNLPLSCIRPMMGTVSEALSEIDLEDKRHVLWLDYESRITPDMLADIDVVVSRCRPGSVLIVTVNADRIQGAASRRKWLDQWERTFIEPTDPRERDEYALLSYRVLKMRIGDALAARNAGVAQPEQRVEFRQAFHMVYADGARMLTVGGALIAESDSQRWDECGIESLDFVRANDNPDDNPYEIEIPRLTRREVHHLLKAVPQTHGDIGEAAEKAGIPIDDARHFATLYRYAPLFVEAEDW